MAWVFMWGKKGKGQCEMTFRGLPGTKRILMKGNWTFEMGHGGRVEKHEKEKQGAYLGNFYLVAQLSTRNSKPGELDRQHIDDLECQSEGSEYHSLGLLAKFLSFTDEAEKGKMTCPRPHDWPVRAKTSTHFFWLLDQRPFQSTILPPAACS